MAIENITYNYRSEKIPDMKLAKQLGKTALQVGTTLASVGYLGALGYKHHGALGLLLEC